MKEDCEKAPKIDHGPNNGRSAPAHRTGHPAVSTGIPFTCNICGGQSTFQEQHQANPELPSCSGCNSNVRFRWLVYRLSRELFGRPVPLRDFPRDKSIRGIGLTDPDCIASVLSDRFTYCNTYLNAEPRLDIRHGSSPFGELDFLIASEVFEHVEPPVSRAFHNVAGLLKPSGVLLLTVPWVWNGDPEQAIPELHDWKLDRKDDRYLVVNRKADGETEHFYGMAFDGGRGPSLGYTREHFAELHEWKLIQESESWRLENRRSDGKTESFHNLVFHEGPGLALEMRLFTNGGLQSDLQQAGFASVEFEMRDYMEAGIIFPQPWSRPVAARRHPRIA